MRSFAFRLFVVASVCGGFLFAGAVLAQDRAKLGTGEAEIVIKAESLHYSDKNETVVAVGGVVVRHGETELRADEVRLNQKTQQAEAIGNVVLSNPEGVLEAQRVKVNLEDETGMLIDARLEARRQQYSLSGERIEKGIGQQYHVEDGRFTTCRCEEGPQSWTITARELNVDIDGYGCIEGGRFLIRDVPVLYVPRAVFPVSRERQSGLLMPSIGFTNRRGLSLLQPIYWAIDKSQDATFGIDIETAARLGLLTEYRYVLSRDSYGQITATYFNEAIRGAASESIKLPDVETDVPENRWGVFGRHTQNLEDGVGYVDLQLVGDDLFLREINTLTFSYDEDVAQRTRPFTRSVAGLLYPRSRSWVQLQGVYYQDLVDADSLALQRVPELRADAQESFGRGLLARLDVNATNFQRSGGIAGMRADIRPSVHWRAPLGRSVFGGLGVRVYGAGYQLTEDEMSGGFTGTDPDAPDVRLADTSGRLLASLHGDVGTAISRIYRFGRFGVDRIKHVIEPHVRYLYIPEVGQDDIMVFDGRDRIDHRNLFTYGFSSRLLARQEPSADATGQVFELTRLSVWQSVDVERRLPSATEQSIDDHISDIDFALRINPSRRTRLRFRSSLDPSTGDFSQATVGIRLLESLDGDATRVGRILNRTSFGAAYRFVTNNPLGLGADELDDETPGEEPAAERQAAIQQIDADIVLRVTDHLGLVYANRYNFRDNRFLENHFGLKFLSACDCWALEVGVTDKSNPDEIELRAQLSLVGLGSGGF